MFLLSKKREQKTIISLIYKISKTVLFLAFRPVFKTITLLQAEQEFI